MHVPWVRVRPEISMVSYHILPHPGAGEGWVSPGDTRGRVTPKL